MISIAIFIAAFLLAELLIPSVRKRGESYPGEDLDNKNVYKKP